VKGCKGVWLFVYGLGLGLGLQLGLGAGFLVAYECMVCRCMVARVYGGS